MGLSLSQQKTIQEQFDVGYVCVNEIGDLIKPHYVTERFPKLLKANGLRHIRFHDLRHPYVKHTTKNIIFEKQKSQFIK